MTFLSLMNYPIKFNLMRELFSFTGTRKSPLNIFLDHRINHAHTGGNSSGAGGRDGVPFGIFPYSVKGWHELELSLTCRQGDFAEDLSEEGMQV